MLIYIQVLTGHAENILLISHSIFKKKNTTTYCIIFITFFIRSQTCIFHMQSI